MRNEDKPAFGKLLAEVMAGYGKPLPDGAMVNVWFNMLTPFEPKTIRRAFESYAAERPDFAPAPNGIAARCKLMDGRPDENEAWALSLASQDERETVVWTEEMAKAFYVALPLLNGGEEVGARMAFKDAYSRLVAEARAENRPAKWSVSAGWDNERRAVAIERATIAGLLEGPQPHLALPNESGVAAARPEGLLRVLEAIEPILKSMANPHGFHDAEVEAETEAQRKKTEEINAKVKEYLRKNPKARYGSLPIPEDGE
jgi:hypothetical protein